MEEQSRRGDLLKWPVGVGGKGNEGVAGLVKQLPGAVGYVELIYVLQNNMTFATVKNKSGNWIVPSLASTSEAGLMPVPADVTKMVLTDTDAPKGIRSRHYLDSRVQGAELRQPPQGQGRCNDETPLVDGARRTAVRRIPGVRQAAKGVVDKAEAVMKSVTYNGTPVLQ